MHIGSINPLTNKGYDKNDLDIKSRISIAESSSKDKSFESLFENEVFPTVSTEAFSPVLPTSIKMGKLFKIRTSTQSFNKSMLMLKKFRSMAFLPLVTSQEDVAKEVKLCFGEDLYKRMVYNYVVPKRFKFKNILMPGSKMIVKITDIKETSESVSRTLPKLTSIPTYYLKNNKNTIFDFSDLLNLCWPTSAELSRPNVMKISDEIILQILYELFFGYNEEMTPMFKMLQTSSTPIDETFDSAFISIPITSKNVRLASMYLDPKIRKIPNSIRKSDTDSIAYGLTKFIVDLIDNNPFEGSPLRRTLAERIKTKDNFIFFIHNEQFGFYIDPVEFAEKKLNFNMIFRLMRSSFKALLAHNGNEIDSIDIDNAFNDTIHDDDIEQKLNLKLDISDDFTDQLSEAISSSDTNKEVKDIKISKDDELLEGAKRDKVEKETSILLKTQMNNLKVKDTKKKTVKEKASMDDILDSISDRTDDFNFEDEDDLKSEDTKSETEDTIETTQEFLDEIRESNGEFIKEKIIEEAKKNMAPKLTAKQQAKVEEIRNKYKSVKFDDDRTFEQILKDTDALQIDIEKGKAEIKDDSFNYSILKDITSSYINKTMSYDMVNILKSLSEDKSIPMNIVGFEKKDISDQFNDLELYTFDLEGDDKRKHKIQFKFPKVTSDGFMYLNGNKKVLKKQWILKPITKTSADEVYLSSDYNKTHIFRQGKDLNRNTVTLKKLLLSVMSDPDKIEGMKVIRGDNSMINGDYITAIEYDDISKFVDKILFYKKDKPEPTMEFFFNQKEIRTEIQKLIDNGSVKYEFKADKLPIGIVGNNVIVDVSTNNSYASVAATILSYIKESGVFSDFDKFVNTVTIPKRKMLTKIELQSKSVPLVVFLSTLFTFTEVLKKSQADYFVVDNGVKKFEVPSGKSITEYSSIKFKDKTFYYNQYPMENALLLNGLAELDAPNINFAELDELGTYLDYIYNAFKIRSLYKGWTAFRELFLTPITKEILRDLKQPTEFLEVFLYANSLLSDNGFLPPNDARNYRIRDYEMLNTYLYESISESYRNYKQKGKQRFAFTIPEDDIIKKLNKSLVLENYDATNPLNELKSKSAVTYKGPQGVNMDRAFKLDRRGQTKSQIGIIGISNPENATVGIMHAMTLNPRITSTRGYIDAVETDEDLKDIPAATLLTAEEAAIPYITRDDPKRIGFTSSQTKHVIPADNFDFPIVGTGFESTVLNRIGDDFGYKAKKNGVISAIDDINKFVVIKYNDGTSERVDYGNKMMRNSDFFLANNIDVNVKVGDSVKKGDIVTYNKDFFKKHMGKLMYTQGVLAKVAVLEGEMTEEDSSCITTSLAERLSHTVIKRKQIVLGANSNIVKSVKVGDFVRYGDPLILYEDQKDTDADMSLLELLGQVDDSILDKLTRHNGEANYTGTVSDIKVYWTIDPEQMSDSVKKYVKQYIKNIKQQIDFEEKSTGIQSNKRHDIEVSVPSGNGNRINGMALPKEGGVLIEYYIRHSANKRGGDKITVNSALKSVITQVIPDELAAQRCVDTKYPDIDVIFSLISVDNRMVTSIWHTGYLQKIMFEYPKRLASEFLDKIK